MSYITTFDSVFFAMTTMYIAYLLIGLFVTPKAFAIVAQALFKRNHKKATVVYLLIAMYVVAIFGFSIACFMQSAEGFWTSCFWGSLAMLPFFNKYSGSVQERTIGAIMQMDKEASAA